MNTSEPLTLLGGRSPDEFMRRYWHKKPLLIRGAIPGFSALLERGELFDLAAQDDVESRLIAQVSAAKGKQPWQFKRGPFVRRALPALRQPRWTLLVQGANLYDERVRALMNQFRFVPDARLDDLMISYATDGGGVGPHFDSYDVFLLQAHGRRRWRIGRQKNFDLMPDMPLKILAHFEAEEEYVLEPGDMLYLPPRWAHDGIAEGECMTYSIGFRSPGKGELAQELLQRLADEAPLALDEAVYRDPRQAAVQRSGAMPQGLVDFADAAVRTLLADKTALPRALGEYMSEPKANVWFEHGEAYAGGDVHLDRRSRMLYDDRHVFINGESFVAAGKDATLMRKLCDAQWLAAADVKRLSAPARDLLSQWCEDGWLYAST